ncbi:MAG: phage tail tube protein [Bryobacteraceae bacterium]
MTIGQAVAIGGELRFISTVVDTQTVDVNAPFSVQPTAGTTVGPTVTYSLKSSVPSISIFDYWTPVTAVQRLLAGVAVNEMRISINGDFHEFEFRGPAQDIIDTESFVPDQAGLTEFPLEPTVGTFGYSIVPGHMGQVWLGSTPSRFYTLTAADIKLDNGIETRSREFGLDGLRCITPGERNVTADFELYADDKDETKALYESARQRSPIRAMFQLGQQPTQLFGVYMKSVMPEVPQYDDSETRLSWKFSGCRAQGTSDDEIVVAFG